MIAVFAFGAGLAYYAGNFAHDQITNQLRPQQISFPPVGKGLPADLNQYAGQQVLNGDQAHAYADKFIALHLSEMGNPPGKPYSYWSTQARTETDPAKKTAAADLVTTIFRGETLRSMLNQAWAFGAMGDIAICAAFDLALAALLVIATLVFELFFVPNQAWQPARASLAATSASYSCRTSCSQHAPSPRQLRSPTACNRQADAAASGHRSKSIVANTRAVLQEVVLAR